MKHKLKPKGSILAALILMALVQPSWAMSCGEIPTFEKAVDEADAVFEGHFVRYGLIEAGSVTKNPNVNFNKEVFYALTKTFAVEKAWKGVSQKQEVTSISPWPIPQESRFEVLEKIQSDNRYKNKELTIFALEKIKVDPKEKAYISPDNPEIFKNFYYDTQCGGAYDVTAENIKVLQKIFSEAAAKQ